MIRVQTDIILLYLIFENNEKMTQGSHCQMKEWDMSLEGLFFIYMLKTNLNTV